jgi:DNA modification methylase
VGGRHQLPVASLNELHFGDNLDVLRAMPAEYVDLIYLDPPFNSNADYNLLYGTKRGGPSQAQAHAFEDMWRWGPDAQEALDQAAERHLEAGAILDAFQKVFEGSNMMAYLAMMAVRLIELQRVLKPTGALFLHCDPTASHYLKILLDGIFGAAQFRNEIIWQRGTPRGHAFTRYASSHDTIFYYGKSGTVAWHEDRAVVGYELDALDPKTDAKYSQRDSEGRRFQLTSLLNPNRNRPNLTYDFLGVRRVWRWTKARMEEAYAAGLVVQPSPGAVPRFKRYLDEQKGKAIGDIWTDIAPINSQAQERLQYPTQKPVTLLERIIDVSSNPGDVVLDPFCGCGTAIEAAQRLGRNWIGIDVTYLAIHVIEGRLKKVFGNSIVDTYKVFGRPRDADDARMLAARDWLEFQKWAVFALGGLPKDRPGPDGGIDGIIRYHRVGIEQPNRAVVSVKGGLNVGVDAIHKLKSVVDREKAALGILICLDRPSQAMTREALSAGQIGPSSKRVYKLQIVTVDMLFERQPIDLPGMIDAPELVRQSPAPAPKKSKHKVEGQGELLFPIAGALKSAPPEVPRRVNRSIREVDIEVMRPFIGGKSKA